MKKLKLYRDGDKVAVLGFTYDLKGRHIIVKDKTNKINVLGKLANRYNYYAKYNIRYDKHLKAEPLLWFDMDEEVYLVDERDDKILKI